MSSSSANPAVVSACGPDPDAATEPDYYFENGFMVFTAAYLLKRGSCCGNKCRHCPYPPAAAPEVRGE